MGVVTIGGAARAQSVEDLQKLSIEQLATLSVTSASKTSQSLSDAPTAMYVITHDDIIRSGAISIPEVLRLAPNLQVRQVTASQYVITARGFSGNAAAQSFSDKLLVLIDGRAVYSPLYSGVYWDVQDVLLEDVDRIEVISGPGSTLWGANAVNGVVNIITRKSSQTQGGFIQVGAGDLGRGISLRYGGKITDGLTYRIYAKDMEYNNAGGLAGLSANDHWSRPQAGFRLDWTSTSADVVTVQGDAYRGVEAQSGAPDQTMAGRNIVTRWTHAWNDDTSMEVQAYYDRTDRITQNGGGAFSLDTYDLSLQDTFKINDNNTFIFGLGGRINKYWIDGTPNFYFAKAKSDLDLADVFAQDTYSIFKTVKLTLGLKLESDPYVGASVLPNARVSWKPMEALLIWGAASQAIRTPTPFDNNVVEKLGGVVFLTGNPNFRAEKLTAYEVGVRSQPLAKLSFSISTYYNIYNGLRTIEPTPGTFIPLYWGNGMQGEVHGLEAWSDYQATPWWRLSASVNVMSEALKFKPGASGLLGLTQNGADSPHQASLKSSLALGPAVTWDADLRYVDALPGVGVPAYVELNSRLAWTINKHVQVAVSGFNLLHDQHLEAPAPSSRIARSFFADLRFRF